MKTTSKTGNVVAILSVKEDSDLMIVSQNGKIIRIESRTIRQAGRSTQGVRLVSAGRRRQGGRGQRDSRRPRKRQDGRRQSMLPLQ